MKYFCHTLIAVLSLVGAVRTASAAEDAEFFERHIRPILVERCYQCHSAGAKTLKGGLRLDTRDGVRRGGESGTPAVVPGDTKASRLIESVTYENADLRMPPKHKLSDGQVADLVAWVRMGAPDPRTADAAPAAAAPPTFWSFQRPIAAAPPDVKNSEWAGNPIDQFVAAKLEGKGLKPSPEADRRTLIRRATFDLTGLPPAAAEVDAFVNDRSPGAYDQLVDRLLASPRYGQRWARYWLDLARYSDTKGYVYDREERHFVHAHAYRDWVIAAFNRDLPYDRFLTFQVAADALQSQPGSDRRDLAAMGFLTVGRRFLGVTHDIIDDRIDVLTRTTQGLTVACARCHDHKFDPVPTADYYSIYGVFAASTERLLPLDASLARTAAYQDYEAGLRERQKKLDDTYARKLDELTSRLRAKTEAYLVALLDVEKLATEEFYELRDADDLNPVVVRQWQSYLFRAGKRFDPVFAPWHELAAIQAGQFAADGPAVIARFAPGTVNRPLVEQLRNLPPKSMADVAHAYGQLLAGVDREWRELSAKDPAATALPDPDREQLRRVLYGPGAPVNVPAGSIADTEWFFDENTRVEIDKLQAEVDRWNIQSPGAPDQALVLEDRPAGEVHNPRVFRRGNPADKGQEVPRQFLGVIAGAGRKPFEQGSGRLEMAKLIASRENPLTARVMVNRVWQHHFGEGLVRTPSDFGARCAPPTHPELLDWLAVRFMDGGWSLKSLHKLIMTSATYRQSSADDPAAGAVDPENQLLWRMKRTRLDFEAMRDSLLAASGELDETAGGRPAEVTGRRRTVYCAVDRQFLPGVFRTFDFANPDLHVPQRSATTVPQQALFLMNSPFVADRARTMAARPEVAAAAGPDRVRALYRLAYQRDPTDGQVAAAMRYVEAAGREPAAPAPRPNAWLYGYGRYDSSSDRVSGFTPLPHFAGDAWQGGPSWPDGALGWVRLTADGGHPGNDYAHAAVRRWVAPADMVIRIGGVVRHDPSEGKGVNARIVSSKRGTVSSHAVHHGEVEMKTGDLVVEKGETIDFVVDFAGELNSNQFLWTPVIRAVGPAAAWDAAGDFSLSAAGAAPALDPWASLAHVLLLSNEFAFID